LSDLLHLWRSRKQHGFPWPFQFWRAPTKRAALRQLLTGYVWHSPVPLWKQLLCIPLRPYRYARMVKEIARVRSLPYHETLYDSVP
jgi:hypothetical protein